MLEEHSRQRNEGAKRAFGLLRLRSLLIRDSTNKEIPSHQRPFYRALSKSTNFNQLPKDLNLDKIVAPGHGNRYRLYSAFLYSMLKTEKGRELLGQENPSLYSPGFNGWEFVIHRLLTDDEFARTFIKSTELSQQAIYPEAVFGLRVIINKLNPDNMPLRVFDFGCGQNFDLPVMQVKETAISNHFNPPEQLQQYNRPVNLSSGIGIDSNQAADIEWTKICTTQHYKDRKMVKPKLDTIDELARIRNEASNVHFLHQSIFDFKPVEQGDFVLTKWMRYQMEDQDAVKKIIFDSLKDGGYWISVGEVEKLKAREKGKKYDFKFDEVWVWRKEGDRFVPVTSGPLMTLSYGKVVNFNKNLF
ncbi:MAG: hypothetical protein ACOYUB_01975 [Patescibacteria group bacterium]